MYELVKITERCYYMDCPAKVGFYKTDENEVVSIDSGSDKDSAKKVKKILDSEGWELKSIYNTHSHADHTGGNQYLQNLTGCRIFAPGTERSVSESPILEPAMLYGGFPMQELHNKFLLAKESKVERLSEGTVPGGMEIINLPGHSYDMVGFRTDEDVVYLADCLSSEETLEKYQIGFLYDVKSYLETLEKVKEMKARCFVPAHADATDDIAPLAQLNIDKTNEIADRIKTLLSEPLVFEDLLEKVFCDYGLTMNLSQRVLVGSTVKSYLSYLKDMGQIEYRFESNRMIWQKV